MACAAFIALGRGKVARSSKFARASRAGTDVGSVSVAFLNALSAIAVSSRQLEHAEIGAPLQSDFLNGAFDFGSSRVKVLEAGQRVAFNEPHIVRKHRQRHFRARLRLFELPVSSRKFADFTTNVRVAWQEIGRAAVLSIVFLTSPRCS